MFLFRHNKCAAFTWDQDSNYYGVFCDRTSDTTRVRRYWQAQKKASQSSAELLAAGRRELGLDDDTIVIVGGNFRKACFVDLTMPRIAPEDMRGAVQFELGKYSPIAVDDLVWGYRNVNRIAGTEMQLTRVVYVRRDDWNRWIEAASGLGHGVDMIIPASAVLDPMFENRDIAFSEGVNGDYFVFKHGTNGQRQVTYTTEAPDDAALIGVGDQPLLEDWLVPGELDQLEKTAQASFMPAILLSRYGLSEHFHGDHKHWLPLPLELQPRRNRTIKLLTTAAIAYLVFVLSILGCCWISDHHQQLQSARMTTRQLERQLYELKQRAARPEIAAKIDADLSETRQERVRLSEALAELTHVISDNLWSTNFTWKEGHITAQLQAEQTTENLTAGLRECIIFFPEAFQRHHTDPSGTVKVTLEGTVRALEDYLPAKAERDTRRAAERQAARIKAAEEARLAAEEERYARRAERREQANLGGSPPPPPPMPVFEDGELDLPKPEGEQYDGDKAEEEIPDENQTYENTEGVN